MEGVSAAVDLGHRRLNVLIAAILYFVGRGCSAGSGQARRKGAYTGIQRVLLSRRLREGGSERCDRRECETGDAILHAWYSLSQKYQRPTCTIVGARLQDKRQIPIGIEISLMCR